MLSKTQFEIWCINNQITEKAKKEIEEIRSAQPERLVRSGYKNVAGRYSSRKMGVTIQYESHTVELPYVYDCCEHNDDVLEFYDQPPKIRFDYIGIVKGKEKRKVFDSTTDYFSLLNDSAGWVECKKEEELIELSEADPFRYCKDENGQWRCPPGEAYANKFNLTFTVFSSSQINWVFNRNIKFLEYYLNNDCTVVDDNAETLVSLVKEKPGIQLQELLDQSDELGIMSDDIYSLIVGEDIFVDLKKHILAEPQYTYLFINEEIATAYVHIDSESFDNTANIYNSVVLEVGKSILWDGREWEIIHHGDTSIIFRSQKNVIDLSLEQFESFVKQGKISGLKQVETTHEHVNETLLSASPDALKKANERFRIIKPFLENEPPLTIETPLRTIRSWISKYRTSERAYGNGYIGLLPQDQKKGNYIPRLDEKVQKLISESIQEKYETYKKPKMLEVYGDFLIMCQTKGIKECSYKSFVKAVHKRPLHEQTKKRMGEKAAYKYETMYLEYMQTSIRHGDRPFEIAHIDHTELDIELIDSETKKNLGRPWATFLTDGNSRRMLAVYISFDPPSYRSCMMVLRECVKRYSRLPETIVVDGGKEFSSIYFETVLAAFGSGKKQRPAGKPRYGSVIERLFGTTNTRFINNLTGNTQISKNVRQMTKKNNPKKLAIWTFGKFTDRLKQFAYDTQDKISHPGIGGLTPQEAFALGMKNSGNRSFVMIPYDETFRILTLPSSSKGTAKVEPGRGIKNNYIYYWDDSFRNPSVEGQQVPIRYDPFNIGVAYAFVNKRWVKCMSDYFAVFNGKSEKQIQIATKEIKKKNQNQNQTIQFKINIKIIVNFLKECDSDELILQQMKEQEVKSSLIVIQGGKQSQLVEKNSSQTSLIDIDLNINIDNEEINIQDRYGDF